MLLTESGFASTIFGHGIFTCLLSERRRGLRQRVLNKDYLRGSIVAGTRWVDLRPYLNHTSRRGIVDVVGPYADWAGNPFRRNVENTGRNLLDSVARAHKTVKQIPRSDVRLSGKALQGGPGDRARNALAFGVDRKCEAVPIPPRLRRKRLIPSGLHIMPKVHVGLSLNNKSEWADY